MRRELDRPEWSVKALRESCVEPAQKVLDAAAVELVESWKGLPSWLQDRVRNDRYPRISDVVKFVDVASIAGADLEAARRAAVAWERWPLDGIARKSAPFEFLGLGRTLDTSGPRAKEESLTSHVVWTDAAAEMGTGYRLDTLVIEGIVEELHPLVDPLGTQADEYGERVAEVNLVRGWRDNGGVHTVPGVPRKALAERNRRQALKPYQVLAEMQAAGAL